MKVFKRLQKPFTNVLGTYVNNTQPFEILLAA